MPDRTKRPMQDRTRFVLAVLFVMGLAGILGRVVNADDAPAADSDCGAFMPSSDRWIDTRLDTVYLLNPHLNQDPISTEVRSGVVLLSGSVRSDIDRDLAEEIARSVPGVHAVHNALRVDEQAPVSPPSAADSSFLQSIRDAALTAEIMTRLIANGNLPVTGISVDTTNNIVELSGEVASDTERQLAEYIARNTQGVASVANRLAIHHSG